jgi:hypothetical protein
MIMDKKDLEELLNVVNPNWNNTNTNQNMNMNMNNKKC